MDKALDLELKEPTLNLPSKETKEIGNNDTLKMKMEVEALKNCLRGRFTQSRKIDKVKEKI